MFDANDALSALIIGIAILSGCGWLYCLLLGWRGQSILKRGVRQPIPWGLFDLLLIVITMILCANLFLGVLANVLPSDTTSVAKGNAVNTNALMLASKLAEVAAVLLGMLLIRIRYRAGWEVIGIVPRLILPDLWLGLKAAVLIIPPVLLMHGQLSEWIEYKHNTVNVIQESSTLFQMLTASLSPVILAPFSEEIFFRLLLLGWLMRWTSQQLLQPHWLLLGGPALKKPVPIADPDNSPETQSNPYELELGETGELRATDASDRHPIWPLVLSSILFGAMHISQGAAPFSLFFFAMGVGYLFHRTHRIIPCIVVHFVLNLWTIVLLFLSQFEIIDAIQ